MATANPAIPTTMYVLLGRKAAPGTLTGAIGMAEVCLSVNAERKPIRKPSRHPNTAEKPRNQAIEIEMGYVDAEVA